MSFKKIEQGIVKEPIQGIFFLAEDINIWIDKSTKLENIYIKTQKSRNFRTPVKKKRFYNSAEI